MSSREWSTHHFGEPSPGRPPDQSSAMNGRSLVDQVCSYEGCERINLGGGPFCTSHTGLNRSAESWPRGPNGFQEPARSKPGKSLSAKSTMRKTAQSDWRSNAATTAGLSITVAATPRPGSHGTSANTADAAPPANAEPPLKKRKVHDNPVCAPSGDTPYSPEPHNVTIRWTAINAPRHSNPQKTNPSSRGGHAQRPEQFFNTAQHHTLNGVAGDFAASKSADAQGLPPSRPLQPGVRGHALNIQRTGVGEADLHVAKERYPASPMPPAPERHPHSPLSPKHSDAVIVPVANGTHPADAYPQTHAETRFLQPRPRQAQPIQREVSPFFKTCLNSSHQPAWDQPPERPHTTRDQGIVRETDVNGSYGWQAQNHQTPPIVYARPSMTAGPRPNQTSPAIQNPPVNGTMPAYAASTQDRNLSQDPYPRIRAPRDRPQQTETPPMADSIVKPPRTWLEQWKVRNAAPRVPKSLGRRGEHGTASTVEHTTPTNGHSAPPTRPSPGWLPTISARNPLHEVIDLTQDEPEEPERPRTEPTTAADVSTASYRDSRVPAPNALQKKPEWPPARPTAAADMSATGYRDLDIHYPNSTQFEPEEPCEPGEPERPSARPTVATDMSTAGYRDPCIPYPNSTQLEPNKPGEPERPPARPTVATNVSTAIHKDLDVPFPDLSILLALERGRASSKATTQPKDSAQATADLTDPRTHRHHEGELIAQPQDIGPYDIPEPRDQTAHLGPINGDPVQPARQPRRGSDYGPTSSDIGLTKPDFRPTSSLGPGEDPMSRREERRSPSVINTDAPPAVQANVASQGLHVAMADTNEQDHGFTGGENFSPVKETESLRDRPCELSLQQYREAVRRATFRPHGVDKLDQYIYSPDNEVNRYSPPTSNVPAHTLPWEPVRAAVQWGYFDPRVHWTWERPPEWHQNKMLEIAQRGNRKSRERFGRGTLSLARRLSESREVELPERVRKNPAWVAAVEELRKMEEQSRRHQRDEARRSRKGKEREGGSEASNITNHHDDDDYEVMTGGVWRTISRRADSAGHDAQRR